MPDEICIIKNGETVYSSDSRLLDPNCSLEEGVVIRPEPPQIKDTGKAKVLKSPPKIKVAPQQLPAPSPAPIAAASVETKTETTELIEVEPTQKPEFGDLIDESGNPAAIVAIAAVGITGAAGVAVAGAAANSAAFASTVKLKISSLLGSKTAAVAGAGTITAGAIVAVKALESKVKSYEKDMKENKLELAGISSSVDRIDLLLSKLENDELDPTVECDRSL